MIVTNFKELSRYASLNPFFARAAVEAQKAVNEGIADGRNVFEGDSLYANVFTYQTNTKEASSFETHKRYIDIQMVLEGEELVGYESEEKLSFKKEYDGEADYALYSLNDEHDVIRIGRGECVIFFPDEPHAPGIAVDNTPSTVRKVVFKVKA